MSVIHIFDVRISIFVHIDSIYISERQTLYDIDSHVAQFTKVAVIILHMSQVSTNVQSEVFLWFFYII